MLNRIDKPTLSALARLKNTSEWTLFAALLKNELDVTKTRLVEAEEVRRLQGRAKVLEEILEAVDHAAVVLNRVEQTHN